MSLEYKVKEKKQVIRRVPSQEALEQIQAGRKFIPVEHAFNPAYLPDDYMLIDVQYKGESFKTIVPLGVMVYMNNPGEGDIDDALDEITDFYDEVKDFEEKNIEVGDVSVQGTNWAVTARGSYSTYLTNKLTRANEDDVDVPEWDEDTLESLDLHDDYVSQRVQAMAGVALGLDAKQVKRYDVGDVLKHVVVNERKEENLTREEFDQITCWAGSHYEIKDKYRNKDDREYRIEHRHDKGHKVGKKIIKKQEVDVFDAKICGLEREIERYRREKHGGVGRHDKNLIRQYVNISYVAKENPAVQLPVSPPGSRK
jgi:hypothetical protein